VVDVAVVVISVVAVDVDAVAVEVEVIDVAVVKTVPATSAVVDATDFASRTSSSPLSGIVPFWYRDRSSRRYRGPRHCGRRRIVYNRSS
jgi:hypothetical protein